MNIENIINNYFENMAKTTFFSCDEWVKMMNKSIIDENAVLYNDTLVSIIDSHNSLNSIWNKCYRQLWLNDKNYYRLLKESPFIYTTKKYFKGIAKSLTDHNHKYPYRIFKKDGLYYVVDKNQNGLLELEIVFSTNIKEACVTKCNLLVPIDYQSDFLDFIIWYYQKQGLTVTFSLPVENNNDVIAHVDWEDSENWNYVELSERMSITSEIELEAKFKEILVTKHKPNLLIHSCCGPCSSAVIEKLNPYFNITIFFYNPNIDTDIEFKKRLETQQKIIDGLGYQIPLIIGNYEHNLYLKKIIGLERSKEGGTRCNVCFEMRLIASAIYAKEHNFDFFTTTLSISPHKNSDKINQIGELISQKYRIPFLYSNFKLKSGYLRSIELSKMYDLYRQDYCGCEFSKNPLEKEERQTIFKVK